MDLPTDVWFEIGILLDRYDEYLQLSVVVPKLSDQHRCKAARNRLLKCSRADRHGTVVDSYRLDGGLHRDDLPAVCSVDCKYMVWYAYGVRHRDGDLPAAEIRGRTNYKAWYKNGKLHRDGDLPAKTTRLYAEWYQEGKLHRYGDLPAYMHPDTYKWFKHGRLHRDGDLPAVVEFNCSQQWYQHGVLHRDGDKPAWITHRDQTWYKDGMKHRDGDKPAFIRTSRFNGDRKEWYKFGQLYRDGDQPAVIDGNWGEYWEDGEFKSRAHIESGGWVRCKKLTNFGYSEYPVSISHGQ